MMHVVTIFFIFLHTSCIKSELKTCGQSTLGSGLIIGGKESPRGKWPWMVALIYVESNAFFCGGSLISKQHILTGILRAL